MSLGRRSEATVFVVSILWGFDVEVESPQGVGAEIRLTRLVG